RTLEPPAGAMPEPLAKPADVMAAAAAAAGKVETLRIPHITIHGFCETPSLVSAMERAVADRRMSRASAKVLSGGIAAAIDLYHKETSPNLIIVENRAPTAAPHGQLETMPDVCVAGPQVRVLG